MVVSDYIGASAVSTNQVDRKFVFGRDKMVDTGWLHVEAAGRKRLEFGFVELVAVTRLVPQLGVRMGLDDEVRGKPEPLNVMPFGLRTTEQRRAFNTRHATRCPSLHS